MSSPTILHRASTAVQWVAVLGGVLGFTVFVGLMAAFAPEFAVRLAPLALLVVIALVALLSRSRIAVSEPFRLFWVTALLSVFALWPSYLLVKVGGLPSIDMRRIAAGATLVLALYYWINGRAKATQFVPSNTNPIKTGFWLVTSYLGWRVLSCIASSAPIASFIQVVWEVLYYYSLFYIGYVFFGADSLRTRVHKVMLLLMVLIAAFACVERVLGKNPMVQWAPSNEEFEAAVSAMSLSRIRDGVFRTQGTFEHPLLLSEFAAIAASFAMATLLWPGKQQVSKLLGALALVASLTAGYLSGSRSAFIALGAGVGVVIAMRLISPKIRVTPSQAVLRKISAIGLLIGAAAIFAPVVIVMSEGKNVGEAASTGARVTQLKIGSDAIAQQPILGWGPGNGPVIAGIKTGNGANTMDNYLLSVAIESGVTGLVLFLACLLYPAWAGFTWVASGAGQRASFLAATAGGAIAILTMRSILWMPLNLSFAFLFSGIALAQCAALALEDKK
ncbi:O-antigen ligase-related [Comamonadaceae bacterium]